MTAGNYETTPSGPPRPSEPESATDIGALPPADPRPGGPGRADAAKGEARHVAETAAESGKQVAQTAKVEAHHVVGEAKSQAQSLLDTVRSEMGTQAGTQHHRIADSLQSLSRELNGMAANSPDSGPATDLVHQASRKGAEVATWLQDREPADVLDAVRSYGRRHPVAFLALCGLTGVVAGRLTRSAVATKTDLDTRHDSSSVGALSDDIAPSAITPVAPAVSDGVYGDPLRSTWPAATRPTRGQPGVSQSGSIGAFDVPAQPAGDPLR